MNKKGYSLLEIIVAITIFSIFATSITLAFSTYTDISKKNNIIANKRLEIVSALEQFLSSKAYNEKIDTKVTLVKKEGLEEIPEEIICIQREEKNNQSEESFKAFVRLEDKK